QAGGRGYDKKGHCESWQAQRAGRREALRQASCLEAAPALRCQRPESGRGSRRRPRQGFVLRALSPLAEQGAGVFVGNKCRSAVALDTFTRSIVDRPLRRDAGDRSVRNKRKKIAWP